VSAERRVPPPKRTALAPATPHDRIAQIRQALDLARRGKIFEGLLEAEALLDNLARALDAQGRLG